VLEATATQVDLGGSAEAGRITEALLFPGCANFNALQYLNGLADVVTKQGGQIFEQSRVVKISGGKVRKVFQASHYAYIC